MTEFCGSSDYCNECINNPNGDKRKMTIKGMDAKEYRKKYYKEHKMYYKNKVKEWKKNNPEKYKENNKRNNQKRLKIEKERTELLEKKIIKAKEIIQNLLSAYTTYADSFDDRDNEIVEEAVHFLSEVEK
jgi:hypothetical protein